MDNHLKDLKASNGYHSLNMFNDVVTKRKIDRHLLDINDTITEEDIRNIKVILPVANNILVSNNYHKKELVVWDTLNP